MKELLEEVANVRNTADSANLKVALQLKHQHAMTSELVGRSSAHQNYQGSWSADTNTVLGSESYFDKYIK